LSYEDKEYVRNKEVTDTFNEIDKILTENINSKKLTFLELDMVMSMMKYKIWSLFIKNGVDVAIDSKIGEYSEEHNDHSELYK